MEYTKVKKAGTWFGFIDELLKIILNLPANRELEIDQAHHTITHKQNPGLL